jgi:hypothetical protein
MRDGVLEKQHWGNALPSNYGRSRYGVLLDVEAVLGNYTPTS